MQIYHLPITLHSCENQSFIIRENTEGILNQCNKNIWTSGEEKELSEVGL
jgi:hypothetical protein